MSNNFVRKLTVDAAIRGSVTSGQTSSAIALPKDTEYFTITEEGGGGALRWGTTAAAAAHASQYHEVEADGTSGIIAADPDEIYIYASGGNVNYYIFVVRAGG